VRLLADNHLVLATPQQWDMLSRRWKQRKAVQAVNLFIMDEMQLLGGQQGPTMEVCLCYVLAVAHVCHDISI
jgi:pre-mRNA-splicing helicase BRR2